MCPLRNVALPSSGAMSSTHLAYSVTSKDDVFSSTFPPKSHWQADGSLVLRLFYDRDIYQVSFDLNGGMGKEPKRQTVRYGCPIEEVEEPVKKGYSFKGWYLDSAGTPECQWDFGGNVEEKWQPGPEAG